MSRRETCLQGIKAALERIQGPPDYTYDLSPGQVQRYIHHFEGGEEVTNSFADFPGVIVRQLSGSDSSDTMDLWTVTLQVSIAFYLRGNADDVDINAALADMKRALFCAPWDGFGVGAKLVTLTDSLVDAETGQPLDGIYLNMELLFMEQFGDPSLGE